MFFAFNLSSVDSVPPELMLTIHVFFYRSHFVNVFLL